MAPALLGALRSLDKRLEAALTNGDIRLVRAAWLLALPPGVRLSRRQDLEAHKGTDAASPLLSPQEAVALLRKCNRGLGVLSHGWQSPGDCDPSGARLRVVQEALAQHSYIIALFWDQASLFQSPRDAHQNAAFKRALKVMGDLYASAISTTVLQSKEIPPRPPELDGVVCLYELDTRDETAVRAALGHFGRVVGVDLRATPSRVRFARHQDADRVCRLAAEATAWCSTPD